MIELLVAIGVVGLLVAGMIALLNPVTQLQSASDARRKSDLSQIQRALEIYYNDNNAYPPTLTFGGNWSPYMNKVPQDPRGGRNYAYSRPDLHTYRLYASLEEGGNDPQACFPNGAVCPNAGALSCGGGVAICNYGATSANTSP